MKVGPVPAWLAVALAVTIVSATGFALVWSAPFDDPARTGLGAGLITGTIVGLALAAIQWTSERYEEADRERSRVAMQQLALSRMAVLITEHIWSLWNLLLPYVGR